MHLLIFSGVRCYVEKLFPFFFWVRLPSYVFFRTVQGSKYATFKVDDLRPNTIEVTPIDQWWLFKKAPRDDGKMMSVKEAEELMKKQENFMGPLSLANKVLGSRSLVRGYQVGVGVLLV